MQRTLFCLKVSHLIPPAVALVLVGAWNVSQMRSITALESEARDLREKISTVTTSMGSGAESTQVNRSVRNKISKQSLRMDWRALAERFQTLQDRPTESDMRTMMEIQLQVTQMSKEQISAALDEIADLDLALEEREMLEFMLIEPLIKLDPQAVLDRFKDRIEDSPGMVGSHLSTAMGEWAKTDLTAATAWFDRQIADGTFDSKTLDGKSDARVLFEAALLESLIASGTNVAGDRLASLPEDQRREVLEQLPFEDLSLSERQVYAGLVRQLIPTDEREGSFAHIASQLVNDGGYEEVTTFLDSVNATPEERAAAAKQTIESRLEKLATEGGVNRESVDTLRTWLDRQAPGQTDTYTGKALAEAAQNGEKFDYAQASQLVLDYQRSTGSDEVLFAFLEGYSARSNLEEAVHLAEMISDPVRRAEILKQLK